MTFVSARSASIVGRRSAARPDPQSRLRAKLAIIFPRRAEARAGMFLGVTIQIGGETAAEMKKGGHHTQLQPRVNRLAGLIADGADYE
jgi:hypothetical protein